MDKFKKPQEIPLFPEQEDDPKFEEPSVDDKDIPYRFGGKLNGNANAELDRLFGSPVKGCSKKPSFLKGLFENHEPIDRKKQRIMRKIMFTAMKNGTTMAEMDELLARLKPCEPHHADSIYDPDLFDEETELENGTELTPEELLEILTKGGGNG